MKVKMEELDKRYRILEARVYILDKQVQTTRDLAAMLLLEVNRLQAQVYVTQDAEVPKQDDNEPSRRIPQRWAAEKPGPGECL